MSPSKDLRLSLLEAVGMAQAADELLDLDVLGAEYEATTQELGEVLAQLEATGLVLTAEDEPPLLLDAGRQFLGAPNRFDEDTLSFLPQAIDDLYSREALLVAGVILVGEFRYQHLDGDPVAHARDLVPSAFAGAVDGAVALDLFAASVALMVRLSNGKPAGCQAEEILAVRPVDLAEAQLDARAEKGEITQEAHQAALGELRGLFDLFEDGDVLDLFDMVEPADAALAAQDPVNEQLGVVDQRFESWFKPFAGITRTGYLADHTPNDT